MKIITYLKLLIKIMILVAVIAIGINIYVIKSTDKLIVVSLDSSNALEQKELEDIRELNAQCILVLGASVNPDGTPCPMLKDRLDTGIALYHAGAAPKVLLSGDGGQKEYNEVTVMHDYAVANGVREKDIFLDHAGFSTYESVYRAKEIFECQRVIIVTQEYHLYRALYGGKHNNMEVLGAAANQEHYGNQVFREIREILARDKDFIMWTVKPEPTFLGETIPIYGNGISTH